MAITQIRMKLRTSSPRNTQSDPFFPVKEVPMVRIDGGSSPNIRALVNGITDKTLSTVSDRYTVTTHKQASDIVKNFLDETGLRYESLGATTSTAGSRFFETLTFPDLTFNPLGLSTALDAKGLHRDDMVPTITIRNSYDKTTPVAWDYGMFRILCANGMAILMEQTRLSFTHAQVINPDRVRDVLMQNLEQSTLLIENITKKLNQEEGSDFLSKLLKAKFSDSFKERLLAEIAPHAKINFVDRVDEGRTIRTIESISTDDSAWAVYNIATQIATHEIGNRSNIEKESRRIAKVFEIGA